MGIYKLTCIILFTIILGQIPSKAQNYSIREIDNLQKTQIQHYVKCGNYKEALNLNFELLNAARHQNYQKGVTNGLYMAAKHLCTLGQFKEASNYLNLVEDSEYFNFRKGLEFKAGVANTRGRILIGLGYNGLAIDEFNKGLKFIENSDTTNGVLASLNINKAAAFGAKKKVDSILHSLKLAIKHEPGAFTYSVMSRAHLLFKKDLDSAKYYIDLAETKLGEATRYQKSIYLRCRALYCTHINDLDKAVNYYQKSLDISLEINRDKEILKTYRNLANIYKTLGEVEKSNMYFYQHSKLKNSIISHKNEIRDSAAREYINQKEQTYKSEKNQWLITSLSLVFFVIGGGLLSRKYIKTKYKKKVQDKSEELRKVNSMAEKNELEREALKTKLDQSGRDLIELGKQNDESFVPGFRELYPELNNKLMEINPKLTKSDLSLLGMIWFNFSSKDIARYTFVQHKTVQIKKYRLRKKLELPKGTDLYKWLQNLDSGI